MDETTQFNLRLPRGMIHDMDFISNAFNLSRNDWLKYKLAQMIASEKERILEKAEHKYILGQISDEQYKKLVGFFPNENLKELRQKEQKAIEQGKLSASRYIYDLAKRSIGDKHEL